MDKELHKELEARARELVDEPCTQGDEFILAKKERRQPLCIYCRKPLDSITETQDVGLVWTWNSDRLDYDKTEDVGITFPECGRCGTKDWDFTQNDLFGY